MDGQKRLLPKPPSSTGSSRFQKPSWSTVATLLQTGPKDVDPKGKKVAELGYVEFQVSLLGELGARHTGSTHRGCPGAKTCLRPPICWTVFGEDVLQWVLGCGFSGRLWLFYLWRGHGNPGPWVIFLATPGGVQEAKLAPASELVLYLEEVDERLEQEGCPSPVVVPPPAAATAPVLEPRLGWAPSADLTEAPPHWPWFPPQGRSCPYKMHLGQS